MPYWSPSESYATHGTRVVTKDFEQFCYIAGGDVEERDGKRYCVIPMTKCWEHPEIPDIGETAECVLEKNTPVNVHTHPLLGKIATEYQLSRGLIHCRYGPYEVEIHVHGNTRSGKHFDITVKDNSTDRVCEGRLLPNRKQRVKKILGLM